MLSYACVYVFISVLIYLHMYIYCFLYIFTYYKRSNNSTLQKKHESVVNQWTHRPAAPRLPRRHPAAHNAWYLYEVKG